MAVVIAERFWGAGAAKGVGVVVVSIMLGGKESYG